MNSSFGHADKIFQQKMSATTVQDKEKLREERAFQLAFGEAIKYTALGVTAVAAGTLFLTYT